MRSVSVLQKTVFLPKAVFLSCFLIRNPTEYLCTGLSRRLSENSLSSRLLIKAVKFRLGTWDSAFSFKIEPIEGTGYSAHSDNLPNSIHTHAKFIAQPVVDIHHRIRA